MKNKKVKTTKKSTVKTTAARSKKSVKATVALARINVNVPKSLHNQTKQLALKNKRTIQNIVIAAIKEYISKPFSVKTINNVEHVA